MKTSTTGASIFKTTFIPIAYNSWRNQFVFSTKKIKNKRKNKDSPKNSLDTNLFFIIRVYEWMRKLNKTYNQRELSAQPKDVRETVCRMKIRSMTKNLGWERARRGWRQFGLFAWFVVEKSKSNRVNLASPGSVKTQDCAEWVLNIKNVATHEVKPVVRSFVRPSVKRNCFSVMRCDDLPMGCVWLRGFRWPSLASARFTRWPVARGWRPVWMKIMYTTYLITGKTGHRRLIHRGHETARRLWHWPINNVGLIHWAYRLLKSFFLTY